MALAKYTEEIALMVDTNLASTDEHCTHPTILASRSKPVTRPALKNASTKRLRRNAVVKLSKEERLKSALKISELKVMELEKLIRKLEKKNDSLNLHGQHLLQRLEELKQRVRVRYPILTIRE